MPQSSIGEGANEHQRPLRPAQAAGAAFPAPLFLYLLVVPAALVWPSKRRPALRAVLWCRWRLAFLRLRIRFRRGYLGGGNEQ
jgi:hypothetical protein